MDEQQRAAFLIAQAACAMIETLGMVAANHERTADGVAPVYSEDEFQAVINRYGIGHNDAVTWLTQR